jgi:CDP-4-dehydro-6-deoxyglucose reductase
MSFTVSVQPSARQFSVAVEETILEAALRQGVVLPYGCKNGACGSCKAKVLGGRIRQGPHTATALTAEEAARGFGLMCCAHAESDLTIEARVVVIGEIQIRKIPCRVASLTRVAPDVIVMKLQVPANERLKYLAGQFVELILRDGTRRSYSMASAPGAAEHVELHVRHIPGGRFTDLLFGAAQPAVKERDILRFEGPMGTFFMRDDSAKPVVLLASGTGFAPIKAVIEHAVVRGKVRPMTLYWGGRRPHDLYMNALCEQWAREVPGFRYLPVISDALPEDGWAGRTGFVHRAVMQDFPDLSGHQVYACGAPVVVESAQRDFVAECGLPIEEFFADAFTTAADLAKVA